MNILRGHFFCTNHTPQRLLFWHLYFRCIIFRVSVPFSSGISSRSDYAFKLYSAYIRYAFMYLSYIIDRPGFLVCVRIMHLGYILCIRTKDLYFQVIFQYNRLHLLHISHERIYTVYVMLLHLFKISLCRSQGRISLLLPCTRTNTVFHLQRGSLHLP